MQAKKNDFVEIEFTGLANGEVFDTTSKEEAKKIGLNADVKPIIISVGNEMVIKGFDELLEGKEIGKDYSIKISAEKSFGNRNPSLIKTIPMKVFREKEMNPYPGLTVQMDDYIAKVLSVSGGRVIVDFNNPLAGKDIEYKFKINRAVEDANEKINAMQDFFFRNRFEFTINEKDKKVIFKESKIKPFIDVFGKKFKEITGFDFDVAEDKKEKVEEDKAKTNKIEEKKEDKVEEKSDKEEKKEGN